MWMSDEGSYHRFAYMFAVASVTHESCSRTVQARLCIPLSFVSSFGAAQSLITAMSAPNSGIFLWGIFYRRLSKSRKGHS